MGEELSESKASEWRTMSEAVRMVLSQSQLKVWYVLAAPDTLLVVVVVLAVVVYHVILGIEGIPTRIIHGLAIFTDAESDLAWIVVAVAAVVAVAGVVAVIVRCLACAFGFVIGFVLPLSMLEALAPSRAQWLFALASVSLDRLGGAATIDGGPHSPDGKL